MHEAVALKVWHLVLGVASLAVLLSTLGWRVYQHLEGKIEKLRVDLAQGETPVNTDMRARLDKLESDIRALTKTLPTSADLDRHVAHLNTALGELRQDVREANHRIDELHGVSPRS